MPITVGGSTYSLNPENRLNYEATGWVGLGATVIASLALTASGAETSFTAHYDTNDTVVSYTGDHTDRTRPETVIPHQQYTPGVHTIDTTFNYMPNSPDFTLDDPDVAKIVNRPTFQDFIDDYKRVADSGAQITGIHIDGFASDEQMLTADAGIGEKDTQNAELAARRAKFSKKLFVETLEKEGYDVDTSIITVDSAEKVLDADTVSKLEEVTQHYGFATTRDMIEAYKYGSFKPTLSNAEKRLFKRALDNNRGGKISVDYIPPGSVTTEYETITYCVDEVSKEYVSNEVDHHYKFTFLPLVVPIPNIRRTQTPKPPKPAPEPKPVPPPKPATPTETRGGRRRRKLQQPSRIGAALSGAGAVVGMMIEDAWDVIVDVGDSIADSELFEYKGRIGAAALLLALTTPRVGLDWCQEDPNPNDIFPSAPSTVNLSLAIPFTGIHTGELPFPIHSCEKRVDSPPYYPPVKPYVEECGKVVTKTLDGKPVEVTVVKPPVPSKTTYSSSN